MKRTILLMVLALGMCSINVSAQTKRPTAKRTTTSKATQQGGQVMKFKQVAEDGYVWYKLKRGNLYGARDAEGNNIIPIKYSFIEYRVSEYSGTHFFYVAEGEYKGAYTREGTLVIPINRHYTGVGLEGTSNWICWSVKKNGHCGILDARGKEVIPPIYDSVLPQQIFSNGERSNIWFFLAKKDNMYGVLDLDGNLVCPIQYEFIYSVKNNSGTFEMNCKKTEMSECKDISISYSGRTRFDYNSYEDLYYAFNKQSSLSSTTSSSSSSISSNNSGGGTTTVVVEHHRDPIPVQEWQQCTNCWGEGKVMCLGACGGTGTYYVGDRLHVCSSCGGTGKKICPYCGGQGGKNVTVYR